MNMINEFLEGYLLGIPAQWRQCTAYKKRYHLRRRIENFENMPKARIKMGFSWRQNSHFLCISFSPSFFLIYMKEKGKSRFVLKMRRNGTQTTVLFSTQFLRIRGLCLIPWNCVVFVWYYPQKTRDIKKVLFHWRTAFCPQFRQIEI